MVFFFLALIVLKIKSATNRSQGAKTKAVHSTIKRILLTHFQAIALCMSLNVQWPMVVYTLMRIFSTMSSVSEHVGGLGCYSIGVAIVKTGVHKQATFLYFTTIVILSVPVALGVLLWLYWLVLFPYCTCMACGSGRKLVQSSGMPRCCRRPDSQHCVVGEGGGGKEEEKKKEDEEEEEQQQQQKGEKPRRATWFRSEAFSKSRRRLNQSQSVDQVPEQSGADADSVGEYNVVKTRDVWSYSVVLFMYLLFPSLVRYPLIMMGCQASGYNAATDPVHQLYLRIDMEE